MKHCFIFIVYSDVHYHIFSAVIFRNEKGKQTEMADVPSGNRSRKMDIESERGEKRI